MISDCFFFFFFFALGSNHHLLVGSSCQQLYLLQRAHAGPQRVWGPAVTNAKGLPSHITYLPGLENLMKLLFVGTETLQSVLEVDLANRELLTEEIYIKKKIFAHIFIFLWFNHFRIYGIITEFDFHFNSYTISNKVIDCSFPTVYMFIFMGWWYRSVNQL